MKLKITAATHFIGLLLLLLSFSSCIKDNCRHTYKISTPVFTKLSALRSAVQSRGVMPIVHTGKFFINGKDVFLNEQGKGIHVINNSDPSHPVKTSFINIPGNVDMYINGTTLYADLYCDFLAMDISNTKNISVKKYLTKTFPEKAYYNNSSNPDSIDVITDWVSRDTTVACTSGGLVYNDVYTASSSSSTPVKSTGMAGSMARFAAVNNYMYTVSNSSLSVIDITEAANPLFINSKNIGWNTETIFPYNNKLYIGAGNSMSVYDLQNPVEPQQLSWSGHWCSSDPVIADNRYAYVTLHQANACNAVVNQLEIYDLQTPGSPALLKTYPLAGPLGLSKDGNLLFICDGKGGLKIFNATDVTNLKLISQMPFIDGYDVIAAGGIAYVVAKEGLYQYDYTDPKNIHLISKLLN